jgi:hypothetical protein
VKGLAGSFFAPLGAPTAAEAQVQAERDEARCKVAELEAERDEARCKVAELEAAVDRLAPVVAAAELWLDRGSDGLGPAVQRYRDKLRGGRPQ